MSRSIHVFILSLIGIISVPWIVMAPTPIPVTVMIPPVHSAVARAHLDIPEIGVHAVIDEMGLTSAGAMAIPNSNTNVGWYRLGTRPGQMGSAVIGGHNWWNSAAGVFVHLDQLAIGDRISVIDAHGITTSFVVREMRIYNPGDDASDIFASQSGTHLNLITCSGVYDPATKTYTKRLVIFTDAV